MRGVRFTKAELQAIRGWLASRGGRVQTAILAKLDAACAPLADKRGVDVRPLESALCVHSRGKVVQMDLAGSYGRLAGIAGAVNATVADAELIGAWMARQGWMRGTFTLQDVLGKWQSWAAKARAEAPPEAPKAGFGGDVRQDPAGTGGATPAGRAKAGFR